MTGENLEPKTNISLMFSKFTHHRQLEAVPFGEPFHFTSEEKSSEPLTIAGEKKITKPAFGAGDGTSIEVFRRPRGRPPGSKNKPKPPVIITRETGPTMRPYILEVPSGNDVISAITRFCRQKNTGLAVLAACGTVANVTLRQPSSYPAAAVAFGGRFDILSISATFLPATTSYRVPNGFAVLLASPQRQIIGGLVAGSLIAAGNVFVTAVLFNNPTYHRLPAEEDVVNSVSGCGTREGLSPPASGGGERGGLVAVESCAVTVYSSRVASESIWVPSATRLPPY